MTSARDGLEDERYDAWVVSILDDEVEARAEGAARWKAKRAAELSLIDAGNDGRKAGMLGLGASMNPFDHGTPEHAEWDKHRLATIGARLAGRLAA